MTMQRLDDPTRARLRRHLTAVHWRRAIRDIGVTEGVIRRALANQPVRHTSVVAIRVALALLAPERTS